MYEHDNRVVMTLDAGGTNFVFSAIKGCELVIAPVCLLSVPDDLDRCLSVLVEGFCRIKDSLSEAPVAISFAFPGPADYEHGVIGDLPNFPAFCGGVALGPFLEEKFGIPVFINNDGNLFAYGEALSGVLPQVNRELEAAGNRICFINLLGITLGTGFGAGVVINNCLLTGDNGCGGDVWLMRNKKYPDMLAEESVSIRAIHRVYRELTGEDTDAFTPKDIFDIAEGLRAGNREAAIRCFDEMGEMAGAAIVNALNMVDGIVVIGGGLSGASKYILPGMLREMNRSISSIAGLNFKCLQSEVYNLMDDAERSLFLENKSRMVKVPFADKYAVYDCSKKIGIMISSLGASKAIALGAYAYALSRLQ